MFNVEKPEKILCCHELNSQKLQQRFTYHMFILNNPVKYNILMGVSSFESSRCSDWMILAFEGIPLCVLVLPAFLSFYRT